MIYRKEIDGLRAIAVVSVILFHAGIDNFRGGFVGVDVFFVISGYLITSILLTEIERGEFSLIQFYERRARRILPALFFVMIASIFAAWFLLPPAYLKDFAQSLLAVSLFSSNILFWQKSGYFATAAELQPLLHTWSLSVEEQYYLFFPIFLVIVWRFGRRFLIGAIVSIALISLGAAQWGSAVAPTATFFLLPTRGWELMVGALVAVGCTSAIQIEIRRTLRELLGLIGLFCVLLPIFVYSERTPFPSLYALVPTLGAALVISVCSSETIAGRLLGNKVLVGIGLISYSTYLWHQPLFSFARHAGKFEGDLVKWLWPITLLLGYFSWRFVERPFRLQNRIGKRWILAIFCIGTLFAVSFGLAGQLSNGFMGRLSIEQQAFLSQFENERPKWNYFERAKISHHYRDECNFYDLTAYRSGKETKIPRESIPTQCYLSDKSSEKLVFIWGDSHAQQLRYGLQKWLPKEFTILQVASSGCAARLGAIESKTDYCEHSNWFAFDKIRKLRPATVIVGESNPRKSEELRAIANTLLIFGVKRVILTGPSPRWTPNLPSVVAFRLSLPRPPMRTKIGLDRSVFALDRRLAHDFRYSHDVRYLSLIDYFCDSNGCITHFGNDVVSGITSWDYGHLTPIASDHFAKDVLISSITLQE